MYNDPRRILSPVSNSIHPILLNNVLAIVLMLYHYPFHLVLAEKRYWGTVVRSGGKKASCIVETRKTFFYKGKFIFPYLLACDIATIWHNEFTSGHTIVLATIKT